MRYVYAVPVPTPGDPSQIFSPTLLGGLSGIVVIGIVSFVLFQGVATAALTRAIADSYLGQRADIIGSYRNRSDLAPRLVKALFERMDRIPPGQLTEDETEALLLEIAQASRSRESG